MRPIFSRKHRENSGGGEACLLRYMRREEEWNMRSWIVLHLPSRSLVKVIARSLERVLVLCRQRGWRAGDLMIRVK